MQSYAVCFCQAIFDMERKTYYKLSCEANRKKWKTTGKANGETVSENDCYKVKKMYEFYVIVSIN